MSLPQETPRPEWWTPEHERAAFEGLANNPLAQRFAEDAARHRFGPVPPSWMREAPPRSRDELIAARLDHLADKSGAALVGLIHAVFDRLAGAADVLDAEGRDVFMAGLLAVLAASNPGPVPEARPPATPARCTRPNCVRSLGHDGFHKDSDNEPICGSAEIERGQHTNRVCVRAMGHLGHHTYVMWYAMQN